MLNVESKGPSQVSKILSAMLFLDLLGSICWLVLCCTEKGIGDAELLPDWFRA